MVKLVSGSFMFIIGLFLCFTGVGALIGLPMVGAGLWMGFVGMTSMGVTAVKTGVAAGKVVREMKNSREDMTYIEPEPVAGTSAADEITKLAALLTAGHLTQAEFDQRKAQILSQA
ncbi:SHOCT domain-containing protein [Rhizobium pusense]|uniref:SHOCT domain-containing protein n=1 Tax=Agrobacterium pusense TaxID=648995 RepID=UPI00244D1ACC|nr:SHOCT domain-containing protein [Agrobacterium pusense]MDH1099408.1 SHOCT domain-containing protein [Agrobacterium pusense]MDH1115739.1 SHOCT domain-containing protein [Agrobacterium pusense]MDH2197680.1 SHOCT domain-containing protein [Agrobacterium pusense]